MSAQSSFSNFSRSQSDFEPEVELISLISETLPRYKLRADYSVRFAGYQHSDFNRAQQTKEEITELTNEQIHQTLQYFILCGLRVNKMTETYEDCAALTMLVQEQRSHLDLAANIGLNLVEKNTQLEQRVLSLEEQLEASQETMKQLKHQLALKDDLLRMFHSEVEESEDQNHSQAELCCMKRLSDKCSQLHQYPSAFGDCQNVPTENIFLLDKVNIQQLESKLSQLEEENLKLRDQQINISNHTDLLESKETQLVNDCVAHILESTKTIDRLSLELTKKTNEYLNQHEEISRLLTSKIDLENKTHNLLTENDNLVTHLRDHQTKEFTLTKELADMKDRYDECINLLNEKQDEIRCLKKMNHRELIKQSHFYYSSSPEQDMSQNLAAELEESCKRGAEENDRTRTLRIMEQARSLNTAWVDVDDETSSGFTEDMSSSMLTVDPDISVAEHVSGNYLLRRSIQDDCERRRILRQGDMPVSSLKDDRPSTSSTMTAGSPAKITESYLSEAMFHRRRSNTGLNSLNTSIISRSDSPSFMQNKYPDKLQLLKPLHGSQTLRAWQNLATPSLTKTLFEDQPQGICFRGQQLSNPSTESSPRSDMSQEIIDHRTRLQSDFDDIDYEEPAPPVRAKETQSHSTTHTYSKSKISNTSDIKVLTNSNPTIYNTSVKKEDVVSPFSLRRDGPTVLEQRGPTDEHYDEHNKMNVVAGYNRQSHSWLDRFAVGSIMTSILGYTRPISSTTLMTSSFSESSTSNNSSALTPSSVPDTSLIGRLTNLPPLAKRKSPQKNQCGLNLLTSLASSSMKSSVYRAGSIDDDDDPLKKGMGQVD